MNFVKNSNFDEYVDTFKKLPLKEKKEIVEKNIQEILAALDALTKKNGSNPDVLLNRELIDLKKEESTEDDFVEAMFVYFYSIKELLASFVDSLQK